MRRPATTIVALAVLFHAAGALYAALTLPFPNGFDEIQHLSYARSMHADARLLPAFPVGGTLDTSGRQWTEVENYLNHPSPYYVVLGAIDAVTGHDITALRIVNSALSTLGVLLFLAGGFRLLAATAERASFAAVVVVFPKMATIGGIINNDNAALLASGLLFCSLALWSADRRQTANGWLLTVALVFAGWTKFTVLLAGVIALAGLELMMAGAALRDNGRAGFMRPLALPAAGLAIAAIPTLDSLWRYGRLLWHPMNFYVPPASREALDLAGYLAFFVNLMRNGWACIEPTPVVMQLGLLLLLVLAASALAGLRGSEPSAESRLALAYAAAALLMLILHFAFGWAAFKEDGYLYAAQVRYYYVVWPGVALAIAIGQRQLQTRAARPMIAAAAALLVLPATLPFIALLKVTLGAVAVL